ncbi:MAG: hypothetical protein ACAH80_05520 [Alphaproteobacteria bacterium]
MLQGIRKAYDNFQQTIAEGNYRARPTNIISVLLGRDKGNMPETAEVAMGATMLDTGRSFGTRLLWASAVALLSMTAMAWAALGLAVVGTSLFVAEYIQSRRAREDVITEVNFAGQRVEGKRKDLCRLHQAQVRVMNLGNSFQPASTESTSDTIHRIIDNVGEVAKRVKVLDGGKYGAGTASYEFSEPELKLVNDDVLLHKDCRPAAAASPAPVANMNLKKAWDAKLYSNDEVADRFLALEESLPPDVMEKVEAKRAAKAQPLKPAA